MMAVMPELAMTKADYIAARGGLGPNPDTNGDTNGDAAPDRHCAHCQRVLPDGAPAQARYCSPRCQRQAKTARERERAGPRMLRAPAAAPNAQADDVEFVVGLVIRLTAAGMMVELARDGWRLTASPTVAR